MKQKNIDFITTILSHARPEKKERTKYAYWKYVRDCFADNMLEQSKATLEHSKRTDRKGFDHNSFIEACDG